MSKRAQTIHKMTDQMIQNQINWMDAHKDDPPISFKEFSSKLIREEWAKLPPTLIAQDIELILSSVFD